MENSYKIKVSTSSKVYLLSLKAIRPNHHCSTVTYGVAMPLLTLTANRSFMIRLVIMVIEKPISQ